MLCRAKAYLLTYLLLKQNNDHISLFTQSKLINSLERDHRKTFSNTDENDYMHKMIEMLLELLTGVADTTHNDTVTVLESVYGRKNPSAAQVKLLKRCIPNISLLKSLVASQMFRTKLVNAEFIVVFGKLISLSKPISIGELNLDALCGKLLIANLRF